VKAKKQSLTAFSILFIILAVLCIISVLLNGQPISNDLIAGLNPDKYGDLVKTVADGGTVTVVGAKLSNFFMAYPNGFVDAADLIVFIVSIGGFIGVVMKTGALEAGVYHLVKKMHGREEVLIVILMILFSIGGSTYGMAEETIGFYALITTALVAAGFDTIVAVATVLLGAGCGVLGSTINPFATGAATSALQSVNVPYSSTTIMVLGFALWVTSLLIAIIFVLRYARKVKADKGSTILSLQEQQDMKDHFMKEDGQTLEFTGKHKAVLIVFAISFAVMIASLISYQDITFGGNEEAYLEMLERNMVDGIITGTHTLDYSSYKKIKGPIVGFDTPKLNDDILIVTVDHEKGGILAAKALIESGCKEVLQFTDATTKNYPFIKRHKAFATSRQPPYP